MLPFLLPIEWTNPTHLQNECRALRTPFLTPNFPRDSSQRQSAFIFVSSIVETEALIEALKDIETPIPNNSSNARRNVKEEEYEGLNRHKRVIHGCHHGYQSLADCHSSC